MWITFQTGLGNLATRWPRNIVELVEEQHRQKESRPVSEGFISLASDPVGPSMVSTPSDTTSRSASFVDLQSSSPSGEKKDTAAESPKTAMELASSLRRPKLHTIRGVSIPSKPPPPGPEGEHFLLLQATMTTCVLKFVESNRLLHVRMCSLRL